MSNHLYGPPQENVPGFEPDPTIAQYILMIGKHWKVLVATQIISIIVAIGIVTLYHPRVLYKYNTVLDLGTQDGKFPAGVLLIKVKEEFLPRSLTEFAKEHSLNSKPYSIEVRIPEGSTTLILEAKGTSQAGDDIIGIQKRVADLILAYGADVTQQTKESLERTKKRAEYTMTTVQAQEQFFPTELKRLTDSDELTKRQIKETSDLILNAQKNRNIILSGEATRAPNQSSTATVLILIDNEIQQYRTRLATLEERLVVDSKSQREQLEKRMIENKTAIANQKLVIDEAQYNIDHLTPMRITIPSSRYFQEPLKIFSPLSIVVLMALIGLFVGVIAAFFVESLANASKKELWMQ